MAAVEPYRYAELHLHLGGAVLPRILYSYIERELAADPDSEYARMAAKVKDMFPEYAGFEERLTRSCTSLSHYLEAHHLVEPLQTLEALPYFVYRLLRGAYAFESIAYMELRYNPFFRLPKGIPDERRVKAMEDVVTTVGQAAQNARSHFPIAFTQILCLDSRLPSEINREIVELAAARSDLVCAVDLAGPNDPYRAREAEFVALFEFAKERGLKTTAHLFETPDGCLEALLPLVDRVGHGIQIALNHRRLLVGVATRGQCLEVCPTTYLRTGTLRSYSELRPVFERCFDLGVDIAICTDNSAFNDVRLPREYELLLLNRVISFTEMERCRLAAFRHAFRWNPDAVTVA